jgi:hypothetical protein
LRGVFSDVLLDPKKTITLKMPKPRTIKFTFTGDPKVIQGKTLRVSNGLYDDKRRLYYMWLPYHINADRTVLTVHGVLDGWLSVSADGVKGNYFWSKEIENKLDEISIDLNQHKRHTRKFRIAFEHEGKPVQPEGHVSFYVRTRNKSGTKYEGRLEDGIAEVEGEYSNDVRTLRIVHQGLKGYSLDTGADGSNVTVKLKPIEELDSGIAENIVVPVRPAGRIVGTVMTAEGEPMEGRIKCNYRYLDTEKRARPYGFSQSIKVDDKGRFELSPAPMDCEVEMKFGQFGNSLTKKFAIDSSRPVVERTIRLPKTQPASIEILLPTGEPAKNVRVKLFRKDDRSKKSTGRTDRNGVLKIPRLAVDQRKNYQYQVSSPAGSLRMPIASIEPGDALKVTLKTAHRMAGRITNKFGVPVSNMFVEAVAADGKVVDKAMSDAYGKFELSRLPGKSVRLRATHVWADAKVELTQPYDPTEVKKEVELKAIDNRPLTFNNDPSPLKVARLSESFGIVKHNTVQ